VQNLKPQHIHIHIQGKEKYQRLLSGAPVTAGMKSGAMLLDPGESVGFHKTDSREEAIIILEGQADVYIEGKLEIHAGKEDVIYIPPETNHDIKNSTDKKLRYVYIVAPVVNFHT
jgi:quercetin dioxygenase-like cupin family protein